MKQNLIIAGVGGQGIVSISSILAMSAMKQGLFVKQSEIHGMAQRGGMVVVHLRISAKPIESNLIRKKSADLILSMEPLESLRYLDYLSKSGMLITLWEPVRNMEKYPEMETILTQIQSLPRYAILDIEESTGLIKRSLNISLLGAASKRLDISKIFIKEAIREKFESKGDEVVNNNIAAFNLGRETEFIFNDRIPVCHPA